MKLSERAQRFWDRLAPDFRNKGILTDWDLPALAIACDCLAWYWEFRELLEEHKESAFGPYVAKGAAKGVIKHPYHQMMRDAQGMAMTILSKFGMTPADRTRLSVRDADGQLSGLDELLS